ncbi:hypothetical protein CsatB_005657 [Cannabis sativa]
MRKNSNPVESAPESNNNINIIHSRILKRLSLAELCLAAVAFFLVTVLFVSRFFYSNFETPLPNSNLNSGSVDWLGSIKVASSPLPSQSFEYETLNVSSSSLSFENEGMNVSSSSLSFENNEELEKEVSFLDEGGDGCDIFDGNWVWDETYPLYNSPDCPFMDGGFRCSENSRPNHQYTKWRWQPKHCNLPRFDGEKMLEKLRNKRVVFAGDSIARNQWESLLCLLSSAVSNKSSIYEVNRNPITKHSGYLIFKFDHFNCTVEYYRSPFLVLLGHPPPKSPPNVKYALKVDQMDRTANRWNQADLLILNSGRWWTYEKTLRTGCNFEEGRKMKMNMSVETAYKKSMETVVDWVNTKVNKKKTLVYFRTYSPSHFRGGSWKNGGGCHMETLPELGPLTSNEHSYVKIVSDVLSSKKRSSNLEMLNVTNMSMRRKDGHPSIYNSKGDKNKSPSHIQDCSHWCLPGVPDSWNELLYAIFLKRQLLIRT